MYVSMSVFFVIDLCARYPVWSLMTYLMDVWKFKLTHAAAITNVVDCLMSILPLFFKILVTTTSVGILPLLFITVVSFTLGTGLLWMSTPPVLSNTTNTCTDYKPECLGTTQRILFHIALVAIVTGGAGFSVGYPLFKWRKLHYIKSNTDDYIDSSSLNPYKIYQALCDLFCGCLVLFLGGGTLLVAMWCKSWTLKFGIPAIATLLLGVPFLFYLCCQTRSLNLDFVVPSLKFTKTQAIAYSFRMLISITFLICGIVSSIGDTFFLEQASLMNRKIGSLIIPDQMLQVFNKLSQLISTLIHKYYGSHLRSKQHNKLCKLLSRYKSSYRIVISMVLSVICCIAAALTERKRLDIVKQHDLFDKPSKTVPLTMFIMIPQLILLGVLEGLFEGKMFSFIEEGSHEPVKFGDGPSEPMQEIAEYREEFASTVRGIGIIFGTISVYVVGEFSKRGGGISWFQDTLNKSRLDKYYWFLASLAALNLGLYLFAVLCYTFKRQKAKIVVEEIGSHEMEGYVNC